MAPEPTKAISCANGAIPVEISPPGLESIYPYAACSRGRPLLSFLPFRRFLVLYQKDRIPHSTVCVGCVVQLP